MQKIVLFIVSIFISNLAILNAQFNFSLNGNITQDPFNSKRYILTDNLTNQKSAMWSYDTLNLYHDFYLGFYFNFGVNDENGADGFTFTMQKSPISPYKWLGKEGGKLGVYGYDNVIYPPSLTVEFDTFDNPDEFPVVFDDNSLLLGTLDNKGDHIGIYPNCNLANPLLIPRQLINAPKLNVEDGFPYCIGIEWKADSTKLNIYVNDVLRASLIKDIISTIFSNNGNGVIWGITSATGVRINYQYIEYSTIGCKKAKMKRSDYNNIDFCSNSIPNKLYCSSENIPSIDLEVFDVEAGWDTITWSSNKSDSIIVNQNDPKKAKVNPKVNTEYTANIHYPSNLGYCNTLVKMNIMVMDLTTELGTSEKYLCPNEEFTTNYIVKINGNNPTPSHGNLTTRIDTLDPGIVYNDSTTAVKLKLLPGVTQKTYTFTTKIQNQAYNNKECEVIKSITLKLKSFDVRVSTGNLCFLNNGFLNVIISNNTQIGKPINIKWYGPSYDTSIVGSDTLDFVNGKNDSSYVLVNKLGKYRLIVEIDGCIKEVKDIEIKNNAFNLAINKIGELCDNPLNQVKLKAVTNNTFGNSYKWFKKIGNNYQLITNSIYDSLIVNQIGNYKVIVTSFDGCENFAEINVEKSYLNLSSNSPVTICQGIGGLMTVQPNDSTLYNYEWYYSGSLITNWNHPFRIDTLDGTYNVKVINKNSNCFDIINIELKKIQGDFEAYKDYIVCFGENVQLRTWTNVTDSIQKSKIFYKWEPSDFLDNPYSSEPICTPDINMTYKLTINNDGCIKIIDNINVNVIKSDSNFYKKINGAGWDGTHQGLQGVYFDKFLKLADCSYVIYGEKTDDHIPNCNLTTTEFIYKINKEGNDSIASTPDVDVYYDKEMNENKAMFSKDLINTHTHLFYKKILKQDGFLKLSRVAENGASTDYYILQKLNLKRNVLKSLKFYNVNCENFKLYELNNLDYLLNFNKNNELIFVILDSNLNIKIQKKIPVQANIVSDIRLNNFYNEFSNNESVVELYIIGNVKTNSSMPFKSYFGKFTYNISNNTFVLNWLNKIADSTDNTHDSKFEKIIKIDNHFLISGTTYENNSNKAKVSFLEFDLNGHILNTNSPKLIKSDSTNENFFLNDFIIKNNKYVFTIDAEYSFSNNKLRNPLVIQTNSNSIISAIKLNGSNCTNNLQISDSFFKRELSSNEQQGFTSFYLSYCYTKNMDGSLTSDFVKYGLILKNQFVNKALCEFENKNCTIENFSNLKLSHLANISLSEYNISFESKLDSNVKANIGNNSVCSSTSVYYCDESKINIEIANIDSSNTGCCYNIKLNGTNPFRNYGSSITLKIFDDNYNEINKIILNNDLQNSINIDFKHCFDIFEGIKTLNFKYYNTSGELLCYTSKDITCNCKCIDLIDNNKLEILVEKLNETSDECCVNLKVKNSNNCKVKNTNIEFTVPKGYSISDFNFTSTDSITIMTNINGKCTLSNSKGYLPNSETILGKLCIKRKTTMSKSLVNFKLNSSTCTNFKSYNLDISCNIKECCDNISTVVTKIPGHPCCFKIKVIFGDQTKCIIPKTFMVYFGNKKDAQKIDFLSDTTIFDYCTSSLGINQNYSLDILDENQRVICTKNLNLINDCTSDCCDILNDLIIEKINLPNLSANCWAFHLVSPNSKYDCFSNGIDFELITFNDGVYSTNVSQVPNMLNPTFIVCCNRLNPNNSTSQLPINSIFKMKFGLQGSFQYCERIINLTCETNNISLKSSKNIEYKDTFNLSINELNIIPNPNDGNFKITFNSNKEFTCIIAIFDFHGNKLTELPQQKYFKGKNEFMINIENVSSGSYSIKIVCEDNFGLSKPFFIIK